MTFDRIENGWQWSGVVLMLILFVESLAAEAETRFLGKVPGKYKQKC